MRLYAGTGLAFLKQVQVLFLFLLMLACFASSLLGGAVGQPSPVDNMKFPYSQGIRNVVMTSGDACHTREEIIQKTQKLQMPFIVNNGQVDGQVLFYAKTFGGTVFVTKEGEIVYSLPSGRDVPAGASQESGRGHEAGAQGSGGAGALWSSGADGWHGQAPLVRADAEFVAANVYSPLFRADNANSPPDRVFANALLAAYLPGLQKKTTQRVVSTLPTSNPGVLPANNNPHSKIQNPQSPLWGVALKETIIGAKISGIAGEQPAVTTVNYFTGNDESKWKTSVPTYNRVNMGEVYKGIELSLKAYGNNVEKLFCVKPGASPEFIKVQLDGSKSLRVNQGGQLEADTALGTVAFTKPIAYQEIDGKRVEVDVEYRLSNQKSAIQIPNSEYGFTVASYDKTKDLIIDPLLASTYVGGESGNDVGNSVAIDAGGHVYVSGYTTSRDFPATPGAYQTSHKGGVGDVFVSRLSGDLTTLLASTYLGGTGDEFGFSIAIDAGGNVYVTGETWSKNFPTTPGAYQTSYKENEDYEYYKTFDVFVSRLSGDLTKLLASTYLGGTGDDRGSSVAIDAGGNVYVAGRTISKDFPTTPGAYQTSHKGQYYDDAFVSRLSGDLTKLLASTYLGGSDRDVGDYVVLTIAIDAGGNVYVTGWTGSKDFPTTPGAYQTSFKGGDVFVSRLSGDLTTLLASTYLGGSGEDVSSSLAIDVGGNVYVTGFTYSPDFPTTPGAYQTSLKGGWDVFVSRLSGDLTKLLASTYLGGSDWDYGNSVTIDAGGNVYVTGTTLFSTDFPTTPGAYQTSLKGGWDVFVSRLSGDLTKLLASTYLGGSVDDGGSSVAIDAGGHVYVTGWTISTDFPTTPGAYQTSRKGYMDVFVSRLDANLSADGECKAESVTASPNRLTLRKGKNGNVTITVKGAGDCLVEGVTVTATINRNGKRLIGVSPKSQETDANGQAVFALGAKDKKGTAVIKFKATGLDNVATVQVKVR